MTDQYKTDLRNDKFCMAPWVHNHVWPNGNVYPCCNAPADDPYGSTVTDDIRDIWNNDQMKQLRVDMLAGTPNKSCGRCSKLHEHGSWSMRHDMNQKYGQHVECVELTHDDGYHPEMKLRHIDIRFSNVCNFKCRSCGPDLSTTWYDDSVKLYGSRQQPRIQKPFTDNEIDQVFDEVIPHVEEIYFAGGEPLVQPEHYKILNRLIDERRTDVRLVYNTNFGRVRYAGEYVFDLWKQFKDVRVGASLDASGERAEYMRSGTTWSRIEQNRKEMMEHCPNVSFFVAATVSIFNAWHVIDFYQDWIRKGYIDHNGININVLHQPSGMCVTSLPEHMKTRIREKYDHIIPMLKGQWHVTEGFRSVVNLMDSKDETHLLSEFFKLNDAVDKIREEELESAFPELVGLRDHDNTII